MQGRHRTITVAIATLTLALAPGNAATQEPETSSAPEAREAEALRVFLDCRCDADYIRREIPFVTYVRLRQDAQVHLLVTDQAAGGGGRQYALNFIGQGRLAARNDTLLYDTRVTDTEDLRRRALVRNIKLGLLPFLAGTPQAAGIEISYTSPQATSQPAAPAVRHDPWNYWNFRTSLSGNLSDEARSSSYSVSGSFTANRTTEAWKANLSVFGRTNRSERVLSDYTSVTNTSNWSVDALLVRSVTPHFSAGATTSLESSPTYSNIDYAFRFAPALEYNLYPYSESSRRALVVRYTTGVLRHDYNEVTTYLETTQTLGNQALRVSYGVQQPWGGSQVGAEYSSYLHDMGLNRLAVDGDFDINVARGLSFSVGGRFERVRDQISIRLEELSDEDILLGRRQQSTGHRLRMNMGVSYRFGSIYNNVVNTRFSERGGGGGGGNFW